MADDTTEGVEYGVFYELPSGKRGLVLRDDSASLASPSDVIPDGWFLEEIVDMRFQDGDWLEVWVYSRDGQ